MYFRNFRNIKSEIGFIFIMEDKTILMQVTYTNEIDKREEYLCLSNQDKFKNLICIWAIRKQALINFRSEYI